MKIQTCLNCGMRINSGARRCPKCDNHLDEQTDGSTVTVDIAHNGERVHEALRRLHDQVEAENRGVAQYIRFIVGSGVIREEAMMSLEDLERRGVIVHQEMERGNGGAILVKLKH
jgi:hypothetical protein|tara:strand:+ start:203 stop:547 length:345 start_codon:yes stop_codon:yes gene_type:complete